MHLLMDIACSRVLVIVNKVAINIGVHVSFELVGVFRICPGVELVGHS